MRAAKALTLALAMPSCRCILSSFQSPAIEARTQQSHTVPEEEAALSRTTPRVSGDTYRITEFGKEHKDEADAGGVAGGALLGGLGDDNARQRAVLGLQLARDVIHDVTVLLRIQQLLARHLHPPSHSQIPQHLHHKDYITCS